MKRNVPGFGLQNVDLRATEQVCKKVKNRTEKRQDIRLSLRSGSTLLYFRMQTLTVPATCLGSSLLSASSSGITGSWSVTPIGSPQEEGLISSCLFGLPPLGSSSLESLVKAFIVRDPRVHPRLEPKLGL